MIIDSLDNVKHYRNLSERINKGLEFLEEVDFSEIEPGRYNIDGDNIFAMVQEYDTKEPENARPETHERYIDIQYVDKGAEYMGYAPLEDQEISQAYNPEKDVAFYNAEVSNVKVEEGMFAIFFPNDIHAPGIKIGESKPVKKVVVKILL
ncbi:YhcH/YjgK/YiaL family protein [Plebeiibacterium sediminum]|uniref:YhcH/YjgK/YiaL family protein n=1 Tax=Plebeiibacterium sediminum TaxID=2992112 RepID=A0AAE3M288_9BACT|nr:YhcH/YjgK/YiaL family protein [Plebeiobacterium sediminum]MCW3785409.1 YhcH/YjgK/YiaL family protein [Plebeiobacterium sediminum]